MNLASPAPQVEPAHAEDQEHTESARAEAAPETEAAHAPPAQLVGPASTYDDPLLHAPSSVQQPKVTHCPLSVKNLRPNSLFESYVAIVPGAPPKNFLKRYLPWFFDERDFVSFGEIKKYCLVTSDTIYVYNEESDPSPLYTIYLLDDNVHQQVVVEDPKHLHTYSVTVNPLPETNQSPPYMVTLLLLQTTKNNKKQQQKVAHQLTFDTSQDAQLAMRCFEALSFVLDKKNKHQTTKATNALKSSHDAPKKV